MRERRQRTIAIGVGFLLTVLVWLLSPLNVLAASQKSLQITGVQMSPDGQMIQVLADTSFATSASRNYSMIKLPNPNRMVIDIPDAILAVAKMSNISGLDRSGKQPVVFTIQKSGIQSVEATQTESRFYKAVRLTVYVDDPETLWKLNSSLSDNVMRLSLQSPDDQAKANTISAMPVQPIAHSTAIGDYAPSAASGSGACKDCQVIQDIRYDNQRLEIRAAAGSVLKVKNRFTLTGPSRLVLDLENAVVANKELLKTWTAQRLAEDDPSAVSQIRIGQFDEKTVRIVIEAARPELIQAVYPGTDQRLMTIGSYADASVASLPSDTVLGQLQEAVVGKRDGDTVIRLMANSEIVHRMTRNGDKVTLELLNIAAKPSTIPYDASAFPELEQVKTESLNATQPNSKIIVDLKNTQLQVDVETSYDGKTLDLVFLPQGRLLTLGGVSRAPYPATIVIDAGHGGKDMGANRSGVYEKDLNLQVAHRLRQELEKRGFKVHMTRTTDIFLPLPQITAITNNIRPDVFVSVHQNASTNSGLNGIETYYYTPQSLALAKKVHQKMVNHVSAPDRGVRRAMFYVIHHTPVPAILCEVGYISNPSERETLQSNERQQKTAYAISEGVVEYLKSRMSAQARPR